MDLSFVFFHHTKNKGDLGVLKVKVDLYLQGFLICTHETEHAPFDLVMHKKGIFKTVQVKYRNLTRYGTLGIPFSTCYSTSKGVFTRKTNKSQVDLYAVYCPQTDECYYIETRKFNESITLRVNASRNNQHKRVHHAVDFRKVP